MSFNLWTTDPAPSSRRGAPASPSRRLSGLYRHLFLWVLQTWLAMFYIGAGYTKLSQPPDLLALMMTWPARVETSHLLAIGWIEIALGTSLVVPLFSWALRPVLLWGALGLLIDAGFMALFHAWERNLALAVLNGLLVFKALTVIVGRARGGGPSPRP